VTGPGASANAAMAEYWNSDEAAHWVAQQQSYDEALEPFVAPMLAAARLRGDDRVLDVGCGTGGTTVVAAEATAFATGLDISAPMIDAARRRAVAAGVANVDFAVADVQTAPDLPTADAIISRFGVMFFDDPVVAFTNLHGTLTAGGRLAFACWQPMLANEWMSVPALAAAEHVALPVPPDPGAPGPFAFGDADRVRAVLAAAGFADVAVEPFETRMLLGGRGDLEHAVTYIRQTGMGRAIFADPDAAATQAALGGVRAALAPHLEADGVRLGAAAWIVTARA
jgi:SAM-dependent methyltransferase